MKAKSCHTWSPVSQSVNGSAGIHTWAAHQWGPCFKHYAVRASQIIISATARVEEPAES